MSVEKQIIAIFERALIRKGLSIDESTRLEDLDLSSLDLVEISMAFEEEFEVPYPTEDEDRCSIGALARYVELHYSN